MEYLSLQDIPLRQYDQLHSRRMTSQSTERSMGTMAAANHHMRSSPPIQPGEQNPAKLPSFSEFLHTTRANTPPRTPSRRNGSADSSPHVKPHFEDVAWQDGHRRRNDTLGDIYARPRRQSTEPSTSDHRRMNSVVESAAHSVGSPQHAVHFSPQQQQQQEQQQQQQQQQQHHQRQHYHHHHHSISASYHPAHAPSPMGHQNYQQQVPASQHPYPAPPQHHASMYDPRAAHYSDAQAGQQPYPSQNAYFGQPGYAVAVASPTGSETGYHDIRFHQHVGIDPNAFNRKRRGNLPKDATNLMKEWYAAHKPSPYPTEDQKLEICARTGLSLNQVSNWFINARRRAPQKEARERAAAAAAAAARAAGLLVDGKLPPDVVLEPIIPVPPRRRSR